VGETRNILIIFGCFGGKWVFLEQYYNRGSKLAVSSCKWGSLVWMSQSGIRTHQGASLRYQLRRG